jgi:transposase
VDQDTLQQENEQLRRANEALKREVARLRELLERALRETKRQAAPFSRRAPKAEPARPGRKSGKAHGWHQRGVVPTEVDEQVEVPLPGRCAECGGAIVAEEVVMQYQTDLPAPRVQRTAFRIQVGRCRRCGARVQGRHPRQSSDAVGAAQAQVGPRAIALAAELNKGLGLPYGKTAAVLQGLGLGVSRGGVCRMLARLGEKAAPTYDALVRQVRGSPQVTPDETGWKVGGNLWWMWAAATPEATAYAILPGRGFEQAAALLGADFDGFLVRDGWAVYRRFEQAQHQTCLAHLLRRCRELREAHPHAALPGQVRGLLQEGLELRDRHAEGELCARTLTRRCAALERRFDGVLATPPRLPAVRRFAQHLRRERAVIFTFLRCPGLDATNWRAEQAIRPMVVTRKVWGGNRTPAGARTQQRLLSLLQTCRQQHRPASPFLMQLLCSPQPLALDLRPG